MLLSAQEIQCVMSDNAYLTGVEVLFENFGRFLSYFCKKTCFFTGFSIGKILLVTINVTKAGAKITVYETVLRLIGLLGVFFQHFIRVLAACWWCRAVSDWGS